MTASAPLLIVPFREVRHFQPDDCLHYEPIHVRGRMHQWDIPAHRHEALHQFELLERGAVQATIDGVAHRLVAPAAWMIGPGVMHGFVYRRDSAGHVVTVPSAALRASLAPLGAMQDKLEHPIVLGQRDIGADLAELKRLFVGLAAEFRGARPGRTEALRAHAVLLGMWFMRRQSAPAPPARRRPADDALVQRFRSLLERRFRAHWTVSDYAAALAVTPDHLSRRCRAVAGLGARELVHERLMLEARRLLAYSSAPIVGVAHQLGFDDPGYFTRLFTKRCGQSPSAYRDAIAAGIGAAPEWAGSLPHA